MLLELSHLEISYGDRKTVEDVSLTLDKGQIMVIVGESGSGKTTVIRSIMGCLPSAGSVTGGQILFEGRDLTKNSPKEWKEMSGKELSMIFQDSGAMLNPVRRIGTQFIDYIKTHDSSLSTEEAKQLAIRKFDQVRLPNAESLLARYPFELSGGMRQRVGIAMAMAFEPKLLLADEPTSALDVTIQAQIVKQIMDIRDTSNVAVILVTHNLGVAAYMADKIVVMQHGRIVEAGTKQEVIEHPQSEYTKELLRAVPKIGGDLYYDEANV